MLRPGGEWQEMRPLKETEVKHVGNREPLKAKLKDRVLAELGETNQVSIPERLLFVESHPYGDGLEKSSSKVCI